MNERSKMSQVKFKVRYNSLILKEFTVADIVQATGENPESVRTELQRMRQEGLISSDLVEQQGERGGRVAVYRLTNDREARLSLSRSIEPFYPSSSQGEYPSSRRYLSAQHLLDRAQRVQGAERAKYLREAERDLELAEQTEGGKAASEQIRGHLHYERARLQYLQANYVVALSNLEVARKLFSSFRNVLMQNRVDELELCINVSIQCGPSVTSPNAWAEAILEYASDRKYKFESPLVSLLLDIVGQSSTTTSDKILASVLSLAANMSSEITAQVTENLQATYTQQVIRNQVIAQGSVEELREDKARVLLPDIGLFEVGAISSSRKPRRR